ncbi:MAG: hypothetical protein CR982_05940 [Candidatus Cloacimonadota bacterium]|nr:MAG: hypothetical protein CR982_05940 [Candidatus Cloacimonadota bacterium]PIE78061.1 MAG: hypothetical protein CSA15_09500 [Candidatus Delongbacteria bacterium]
MKELKKYFLTGLVILAPVFLTFYIVKELFLFTDNLLRDQIVKYFSGFIKLDTSLYGVGALGIIIILIIVGWITQYYVGKKLLIISDSILSKIPIVNKILKMLRQISDAFFSGQKDVFKKAVLIEYPRKGIYSIAFYTGENSRIRDSIINHSTMGKGEYEITDKNQLISIFLPTTPNPTSGFLLFLPKKDVVFLDMEIEDALKLVISGGVYKPGENEVGES